MATKPAKQFVTNDLHLAAALDVLGHGSPEVGFIPGSYPYRSNFTYRETKKLLEDVNKFYTKSLPVDAQSLFGAVYQLKRRISVGADQLPA